MKKKKKNKNRSIKRKIIGILCAIAALAIMFAITFIVFGGNEKVSTIKETKVPVIKGMTINQATVALEREGLILVEAGSEVSSEPKGSVIESNPRAGATVQSGDEIRVIVSREEEKAYVKVPNLTGYKYDKAESELEALGLIANPIYKDTDIEDQNGKILELNNVDKSVEKGTTITLTVAKYKAITEESPTVKSYSQDEVMLLIDSDKQGVINNLESKGIKYNIIKDGSKLEDWDPKDCDIEVGEVIKLYFK